MTLALQIEGIEKSFGSFQALKNISLELNKGEFLTMLGPSGSGKSTTLQIVAGFLDADKGQILMGGRDLAGIPSHKRNIGMVFQDYALFPHMTATDNVAFPLEARGVGRAARRKRAEEILDVVNLGDFLDRYPKQLSGGQKQRVALARALVYGPEVVLLDEPLGALDKKLRTAMQLEILRVTRRFGATVISVTHDQEEALIMSDRVALFSQGELAQVGTPKDLYANPKNKFVADFVGESNLLSGELVASNAGYALVGDNWRAAVAADRVPVGISGRVSLLVRPESIKLCSAHTGAETINKIEAVVREKIYLGSAVRIHATMLDGTLIQIAVHDQKAAEAIGIGEKICIGWLPEDGVVLRD